MSNLNDETTLTETVAATNTTSNAEVNASDNGETVTAFLDNGSGGAPADFTLIMERYSEREDRWMEYSRVSQTAVSNPQSVTTEAVPSRMRARVVNDSGASADFRLSVVSY